jgi:hypothetical protein
LEAVVGGEKGQVIPVLVLPEVPANILGVLEVWKSAREGQVDLLWTDLRSLLIFLGFWRSGKVPERVR